MQRRRLRPLQRPNHPARHPRRVQSHVLRRRAHPDSSRHPRS